MVGADGRERVLVVVPLPLATGMSHVFSCCDITRHRVAEQAAEEEADAARKDVRRYVEMIEGASDWFWEMDRNFRYSYFSPNYERVTGIKLSFALGRPREDLGDSTLDPRQWANHFAILRARKPFRDFIYRTRRIDGRTFWVKTSGVPTFGTDGEFSGYRGVASDVTPQVEAERAVRESEKRLRELFEVASDWFWETDANGCFTFLSSAWSKITGQDPAQYIGRRRDEFGDRMLDPVGWQQHLATLKARKPFRDFIYCLCSNDGRIRWIKTSGIPIFDEDRGAFCGYRGVATDITGAKLQEEALRRSEEAERAARERAEQADHAKSQFLATMSHELRTPLNAVIGFAEIIEQAHFGPLSAKYQEFGGFIRKGGQHLLAIINDILDLAKLQSGKTELYREPVALGSIIQDVTRLVIRQAEAGGLSLVSRVQDGLPLIHADPIRLRQILLNFLSNAIKFTPEGGKVLVKARNEQDGIHIDVIDSGIGMAREDIPKALEPFSQIANALNRKHQGTGLGLPVSKALVELHGGRLDITSVPDSGTTVTTFFPAELIVAGSARNE